MTWDWESEPTETQRTRGLRDSALWDVMAMEENPENVAGHKPASKAAAYGMGSAPTFPQASLTQKLGRSMRLHSL